MSFAKAVSRRQGPLLVAVFLCIEFLDEVVDGLSGAAWPLIREDLSLSYTEIGLLLSVPALVAHLVEPPIGLLSDIWRRFAIIALGGFAYATAMMMYAGAADFAGLMAAMVLMYPASGTFVSLSQSSLMDVMPEAHERGMVIWTIAGSVGVAAGPLCLAGALALGFGWRSVYAAIGCAAMVMAVAVWLVRPRAPQAAAEERPGPATLFADAWAAIRQGGVLRWLAALAVVDLLLQVFVGFLALYFVDEAGATATMAAVAVTVWSVMALIGEAALLLLLKRFDGLSIVRRSAWLVAILLPSFLLVASPAAKLALVGLLALFSAGWYSIVKAQFFGAMRGRSGTAMALSSVFGPIEGLAPAIVGFVAEHAGLGTALWVVMLAPLGLIVLLPHVEGERAP